MELYHSSPEILTEIKEFTSYSYVDFGGIFASESKRSALSHHDNLHVIELNDNEILTQNDITSLDVSEILREITKLADIERVYEIVVEENQVNDEDVELFNADDKAHASWIAQTIRGKIAKKLGYKAVEMNDEHGKSYLILAGVNIKHI